MNPVKPIIKPFVFLSNIFLFVFTVSSSLAKDTVKVKEFNVAYFILNDNDPVSNQKGYENRNRDDHGLTFNYSILSHLKLEIGKNLLSQVQYQYYKGLYTRGFGTTTAIKKGDYDYDYFSYILEKHPDWQNIYLYDQTALTKSFHGLELNNRYKNFIFNTAIRAIELDGRINQSGTQIQAGFHKLLNARNFYHKSFTDSSVLLGNKVNYLSLLASIGYFKTLFNNNLYTLNSSICSGIWYNSISNYGIAQFNPFAEVALDFQYGKMINHQIRRFHFNYLLRVDPNERLPHFSDQGSRGFHGISVQLNVPGLASTKIETLKKYYFIYQISLINIYQPIAVQKDRMTNYIAPSNDKQLITGFCNLAIKMCFK